MVGSGPPEQLHPGHQHDLQEQHRVLLQDLEVWGRLLAGCHREAEMLGLLCEFKTIKGIGREKVDKRFLVQIVLMQFRINLDPKIALLNTEV